MAADEICILAATGMLGSGFLATSFEEGLRRGAHVVGCDAGSNDPGPYFLGSGQTMFSREACRRDLAVMLQATRTYRVPMIIGSCGTAGGDVQVDWVKEIVLDIAREAGLHFQLATIYAEPPREYLQQRLREGRILPLAAAPPLDEAILAHAVRVVGMMGPEPIMAALADGADLILCGRATDTSIYAAYPLLHGAAPGPTWHAAKILEGGSAIATQRLWPDSVFCRLDSDGFTVEPLAPEMACTPASVAVQVLHENASPYRLREPGGTLDTHEAVYAAESQRAVRVTGSRFEPAETYTIKLEAAELLGYETIVLAGIRDPIIIRQMDQWLAAAREALLKRTVAIFGSDAAASVQIQFRIFGKNAVMGALEPITDAHPHEIALAMEIIAPSQHVATGVAKVGWHLLAHFPVPEWTGMITSIAMPYNPPELERGPVYGFTLNHTVAPEDPLELFRTCVEEV